MPFLMTGQCRYCGCTESNPCKLQTGEECSWYDKVRTVCNGPSCVRQYEAERRQRRATKRKKTTAEVHAEIMQRGRRKRRAA